MAGETRGYLCEAITFLALERALGKRKSTNSIHWEEKPSFASVKPDFTVGPDSENPEVIILVTACDAPKNFLEKHLRNLCELFDYKAYSGANPIAINAIFYSSIKPDLVKVSDCFFDHQILVDRLPQCGGFLREFVEAHHANCGNTKENRVNFLREALENPMNKTQRGLDKVIDTLAREILPARARCPNNKGLWKVLRGFRGRRTGIKLRRSRLTNFRRGLARWGAIAASDITGLSKVLVSTQTMKVSQTNRYLISMGILKPTVRGACRREVSPATSKTMVESAALDLTAGVEFIASQGGGTDLAAKGLRKLVSNMPDRMIGLGAEIRRTADTVEKQKKFVLENWQQCTEPFRLYQLMIKCHDDSSMADPNLAESSSERVWLYDICIAFLRAFHKRDNDFGYNVLVTRFKADQESKEFSNFCSKVLSKMPFVLRARASKWLSTSLRKSSEPGRRGFQDWLNKEKKLNPIIVASFCYALALNLRSVSEPSSVTTELLQSSALYSLWNKLLNYPDFEPLPEILLSSFGSRCRRVRIDTVVNDLLPELAQEGGSEEFIQIDQTLIGWRSVTDAGKDHKRKELCARIACARMEFSGGRVQERKAYEKYFLVADGTFTREDIRWLVSAGWDQVFYPDEMDKLAKAIV